MGFVPQEELSPVFYGCLSSSSSCFKSRKCGLQGSGIHFLSSQIFSRSSRKRFDIISLGATKKASLDGDAFFVAYCFRLTLRLYRAIPACAPMVGPMLRPMKKLDLPHKWNAMPGCQDPQNFQSPGRTGNSGSAPGDCTTPFSI